MSDKVNKIIYEMQYNFVILHRKTICTMNFITSASIQALSDLFSPGRRVTLVTHVRPDGDALGCTTALAVFLREVRNADVVTLYPDTPSDTIRFILPGKELYLCLDREFEACRKRVQESEVIVFLDGNSLGRAEAPDLGLEASPAQKVLIDHHLYPVTAQFSLAFSETEISSASELLFWILLEMPEVRGDARRFPAYTRRALMSGMTTDTNNFANSVFPSTLRMTAALLEAGTDRDEIIDLLYRSNRESRVRLNGWMQSENMVVMSEGAAYLIATREILDRYDAREGETEGLVNVPLTIEGVKISFFLKEADGHYRVSIRSRHGVSARDVAAAHFHGGGHENAAGGKLFWPDDIPSREDAAAYLESLIRQLPL